MITLILVSRLLSKEKRNFVRRFSRVLKPIFELCNVILPFDFVDDNVLHGIGDHSNERKRALLCCRYVLSRGKEI